MSFLLYDYFIIIMSEKNTSDLFFIIICFVQIYLVDFKGLS